MNLSPQQLAAVRSNAPVIMCVACPGAGKTKTLVARIERVLNEGASPREICCVTYTNAAAKEIQKRFADAGAILGFSGTLHSLSLRLLQKYGSLVGLPPTVSVLDEESASALLEQIRVQMRVNVTDKALQEQCALFTPDTTPAGLVVSEFRRTMRMTGALDFDLILHWAEALVRNHAGRLTESFKYLFGDEIQDASVIDWKIYEQLGIANRFMVGDIDQSVYIFRGAAPKEFFHRIKQLEFATDAIHVLETNYRSGSNIIDAAQNLISHNQERVGKAMKPAPLAKKGSVSIHSFQNAVSELAFIATQLQVMKDKSCSVLFRTNALASQARDYFRGLGIKIQASKHIAKDSAEAIQGRALLSFLANPYSDRAALRWLELRWGKDEALKIKQKSQMNCESVCSGLASFQSVAHGKYESPMAYVMIAGTALHVPQEIKHWINDIAKTLPDDYTMSDLTLAASRREEEPEAQTGEGVTVSTVHASKGTERDTIIMGACEAEVLENGRDKDLESNRRLFYVGCTRAKTDLILTHCAERQSQFAHWKTAKRTPSRFLDELGIS